MASNSFEVTSKTGAIKKIAKYSSKNKDVLDALTNIFGTAVPHNIISNVAAESDWVLETAINTLLEISNSNDNEYFELVEKKHRRSKPKRPNLSPMNSFQVVHDANEAVDSDVDVVIIADNASANTSIPVQTNYGISSSSKSCMESEAKRIINLVQTGAKILILMRGLPGSGKTTLAEKIVENSVGKMYLPVCIYSTDNYFYKNGQYNYNVLQLSEAHQWNQKKAREAMERGVSPIIIDNTNTEMWEMKIYAAYGMANGYIIEILESTSPWAFKESELARRNQHGVPKNKISNMLSKYEKDVTPFKLITAYNLQYPLDKQPVQMRIFPPIVPTTNSEKKLDPIPTIGNKSFEQKAELIEQCAFTNDLISFSDENTSSPADNKDTDRETSACISLPPVVPLNTILQPERLKIFTDDCSADSTANFNESIEILSKSEINISNLNLDENSSSTETPVATRTSPELKSENNSVEEKDNLCSTQNIEFNYHNTDLSDWGINEGSLTSWVQAPEKSKIVEPKHEGPLPQRLRVTNADSPVNGTKEFATNTCGDDFLLLGPNAVIPPDVKIITPLNRTSIIESGFVPRDLGPPKVLMLEKGTSMTAGLSEFIEVEVNSKREIAKKFSQLKKLFPRVEEAPLREVFDTCRNNLDWAVDILLDNGNELAYEASSDEKSSSDNDSSAEGEESQKTIELEIKNVGSSPSEHKIPPAVGQDDFSLTEFSLCSLAEAKETADPKSELKKLIENQVQIKDEFYPEKYLELKKKRRGEQTTDESNSHNINTSDDTASSTQDEEYDSPEETVELNIGLRLVGQLEGLFGDGAGSTGGFMPVIQVPLSLARQLYTHWYESMCNQLDAQNDIIESMIKQDEELARKLQKFENDQVAAQNFEPPPTPDLKEIMDMEIALAICRADQKALRTQTPDDWATKMTKEKLVELFPELDKEMVFEILQAHENNFDQTVETLEFSTGREVKSKIRTPPIEDFQKRTKELQENLECPAPTFIDDGESQEFTIDEYRELAQQHYAAHSALIQKANSALQRRQHAVAAYYLDLARVHKRKFELANNEVVATFLLQNATRNNAHTLDLHKLYIKEAQQTLDLFVDEKIGILRQSGRKSMSVYLITGRGVHSHQGRSRLRPAMEKRLRDRKLRFTEANPGLLKVKIFKYSLLLNELKK